MVVGVVKVAEVSLNKKADVVLYEDGTCHEYEGSKKVVAQLFNKIVELLM